MNVPKYTPPPTPSAPEVQQAAAEISAPSQQQKNLAEDLSTLDGANYVGLQPEDPSAPEAARDPELRQQVMTKIMQSDADAVAEAQAQPGRPVESTVDPVTGLQKDVTVADTIRDQVHQNTKPYFDARDKLVAVRERQRKITVEIQNHHNAIGMLQTEFKQTQEDLPVLEKHIEQLGTAAVTNLQKDIESLLGTPAPNPEPQPVAPAPEPQPVDPAPQQPPPFTPGL